MSIIFSDYRYGVIADFSGSAMGTIVIGGVVLCLVTLTLLGSNVLVQRLLGVGFILGLMAWLIIFWSLATADGPSAFRGAWNTFMGQSGNFGAFDQRISVAHAAGMTLSNSVWTMTLAGLIMGFWIYYGYYIPTFFSEELRNPSRTLFISSAGSLLVACVIFVIGAVLLQRLVPLEWIAAEGYIFNNPDKVRAAVGEDVVALPWITFYAAILKPKAWLIIAVAFGWVFTLINLVQTYFFYSSRIVYAWAVDRVAPDWLLGSLEAPRPTRCIIIISILSFVGLIDAAVGGPLGTQLTFVFFAVVTQLIPVAALTLVPYLRPEMFAKIPAFFQRRLLGIPLVSIIGGVTLLYLIWMIFASFLFPAVGVANPGRTVPLLLALFATGLGLFWWMRRLRLKEEGVDLSLTYKRVELLNDAPEFE
jgi:amino acid transporter